MEEDNNQITFKNVDKYFFVQHQKTLKELVQAVFRKQKTLERVHALNNVNFQVKKGEAVGVIGKNGAGKSTLLKLIAGVSVPTTGEIEIKNRVSPLIELGAGFHTELTGRENIYLNGVILGLSEKFIKEKFDEIVSFSEIKDFIDTPVKFYSSGMYMRLAFSVAIFTDPKILLVDEILAVGDDEFQKKCLRKMNEFKKKGVTIIFVSHSMETVEKFCERVIYLKTGKIEFDGEVKEGIGKYKLHYH